MRILLVGATGALGRAVADTLQARGHQLIKASRRGEVTVDLTQPESIDALFASTGEVDAVACAAGVTPFRPFAEFTLADFRAGLDDKLLGQMELVRRGLDRVHDGGSFTLVSGVLAVDPIVTGVVASTVNGGVEAFVRAAAIELPRQLRINAVSATALTETWDDYGPYFPGHTPVPAQDVATAYVKSIEGAQTGQTYRVGF